MKQTDHTSADCEVEDSANGDAFRYSRYELRRKRRKAIYGNRNQGDGIHGTLRGAPQTLDIFVFRCEKDISRDNVKSFLEENDVNVMDIECVSSVNARYKSFRVSVPRDCREMVMNSDFWPEGVGVRYFRRKRYQFNDKGSQDGDY
jgi:hypothetical protein